MKKFTAWKLDLLDKMAVDSRLTATAFRVAHRLFHYMDAKKRDCFPAQETIAADLGLTDRGVRLAIDNLRTNGWLRIEKRTVPKRRARSNFYHFGEANTGTTVPVKDANTGTAEQEYRYYGSGDPKKEEHVEVEEPFGKARAKKRATRTELPDDFVPDLNYAMAKAGITEAEAREQAEQFRNYHLSKGTLMANWPAAWRSWCGNIKRFSGRSSKGRAPPKAQTYAFQVLKEALDAEAADDPTELLPSGKPH